MIALRHLVPSLLLRITKKDGSHNHTLSTSISCLFRVRAPTAVDRVDDKEVGRSRRRATTGPQVPQRPAPQGRPHLQYHLVRQVHTLPAVHPTRLRPDLVHVTSSFTCRPLCRLMVEDH